MWVKPWQTKTTLEKYLASMLQKTGKLRSLIRELRESYASCESTAVCLPLVHIYIYNYIYISYNKSSLHNTGCFRFSWFYRFTWFTAGSLMSQYLLTPRTKMRISKPLLTGPAQGMWLISRPLWRKWTPSTIFVTTPWPMENFIISNLSH